MLQTLHAIYRFALIIVMPILIGVMLGLMIYEELTDVKGKAFRALLGAFTGIITTIFLMVISAFMMTNSILEFILVIGHFIINAAFKNYLKQGKEQSHIAV